jgi:hypothetical protein
MATTIQIKRGTGSAVPSSLAEGELAINVDSGKLFFGQTSTSASSAFRFDTVIAENYIVSSSVTNITTQTLSGSTAFGDSTDDTHTFTGHITASGNIIALQGYKLHGDKSLATRHGSGEIDLGNEDDRIELHGTQIKLDAPVSAVSHITASGNISSSGPVSTFGEVVNLIGEDPRLRLKAVGANHPGVEWYEDSTRKWVIYNDPDESDNLTFKNDSTELLKLTQGGNLGVTEEIYHIGDTNTKITFTDDDINITVGGVNMIDFTEGSNDEITINEAAADLDVRIEGEVDSKLFFTDASTSRVGIGTITPGVKLEVSGNISASGTITAATLDAAAVTDALAAAIVAEIDNDEIPIAKLAEDSISGVALGGNLNNLTVDNATLQLDSGTTYNGSAAKTISIKDGGVDSDALAADITVTGDLTVGSSIIHNGDTDTKIVFGTNDIKIQAGNTSVFESSISGSVLPMVHQNVYDTASIVIANTNGAYGDIVKFGNSTTVAGGLYFLNAVGTWELTNANSINLGASASLAVAVGTNSTTSGMCIRGFVNPFTDPSDAPIGGQVFMSDNAQGRITGSAPSDTGDIVRVVGYRYGVDLVYFNPSNDFIVHA